MRIINSMFKASLLTAALMHSAWTMAAADTSKKAQSMSHDDMPMMQHEMHMSSDAAMQNHPKSEKPVQKPKASLNADTAEKQAQNCSAHTGQMSAEMHANMQKNDQAHACSMPDMKGGQHEHH
jgi:hypothetical protein